MDSEKNKLYFKAILSIPSYVVIIFVLLKVQYNVTENNSITTGIFTTHLIKLAFMSFVFGGMFIGFYTAHDKILRPEKLEEKLKWINKLISYLAYGIIGFIVFIDLIRGVSHGSYFGGRKRR